jgi:hypothetical protein
MFMGLFRDGDYRKFSLSLHTDYKTSPISLWRQNRATKLSKNYPSMTQWYSSHYIRYLIPALSRADIFFSIKKLNI